MLIPVQVIINHLSPPSEGLNCLKELDPIYCALSFKTATSLWKHAFPNQLCPLLPSIEDLANLTSCLLNNVMVILDHLWASNFKIWLLLLTLGFLHTQSKDHLFRWLSLLCKREKKRDSKKTVLACLDKTNACSKDCCMVRDLPIYHCEVFIDMEKKNWSILVLKYAKEPLLDLTDWSSDSS